MEKQINILALLNIFNHTFKCLTTNQNTTLNITTNIRIVQAMLRFPHMKQLDIAEYLHIPLTNVNMALKRMRERGYVITARKAPPVLTKKGKDHYTKIINKYRQTIEEGFNSFSEYDSKKLKEAFIELSTLTNPDLDNEWDLFYAFFDVYNHYFKTVTSLAGELNEFDRLLTLMYLSNAAYLTTEDIRALICVDNIFTLTKRVFDKLSNAEYITKVPDKFLRSHLKRIEITEKGRTFYNENLSRINTEWENITNNPLITREYTLKLFRNYAKVIEVARQNILPENPIEKRKKRPTEKQLG